jgi:outer membrane receptor protein involved in Fe transport
MYREVIGAENVFGNPDLKRALIDNYDVRYEWYPAPGEVLSLGVFAKRFTNPIERVYVAASGTALVTFVNATGAENYGVELEARKNLSFLSPALAPVALFTNATLMHSEIRIGSELASKTTDERPMVGQAPYVFNAGLTYSSSSHDGTSATLLYNVVGKRITSAAEAPLPDVYEMPRHGVDLSLRLGVRPGLAAKLDAKNLLDSAHQVRQGDVVREYYRAGRVLSIGLMWQL